MDDACKASCGNGQNHYSLATGSPGELGLLKKLAEVFNKEQNATMCWENTGSGKSLTLLKDKNFTPDTCPCSSSRKKTVADGWATKHPLISLSQW